MSSADIITFAKPSPQQTRRLQLQARALSETRYRLRAPDGSYLHACDFSTTTPELAWAWIGFRQNLTVVLRANPRLAGFTVTMVPPTRGVALLPSLRGGDTTERRAT